MTQTLPQSRIRPYNSQFYFSRLATTTTTTTTTNNDNSNQAN